MESPWKVGRFHFSLKSLQTSVQVLENSLNFLQPFFLMLFGFQRQNISHSLETLMVIYVKRYLVYIWINYQFKTSKLKNVKKLMKPAFLALKSRFRMDWECTFLYNLWNYIPGRWSLKIESGPWKVLKNSCNCWYEPWMAIMMMTTTTMTFTLTLRMMMMVMMMAFIMILRIINIVRLKLRSSKLS